MATTFTLKSNSYDGRYLQLTCSQTKNISANTSTISWKLEAVGGNSNFYSTGPTTVYINGQQVYSQSRVSYTAQTFPAAKGSTSGSLTVQHSSNGSKTISVSLSTAIYYSDVSTTSGNWTLDSNPRAASIVSATDFTDETNPTITYSNPMGSSATLAAYIYDKNDSVALAGPFSLSATSGTATLSLTQAQKEALYAQVPSGGPSVDVLFWIKTTLGSSSYWSNSVKKKFSIVNAKPDVKIITLIDTNNTTAYLTGGSAIVKGHSDIDYKFSATAKKGGTIASYKMVCGDQVVSGAEGRIERAEHNIFTYSATDNHGFTAEKSYTALGLVDYINVSCQQEAKIELAGETGAKITLTMKGNYFNGDFGEVANFLDLFYRITDENGEWGEWTYIGDIQPTFGDKTYSLTLTIDGLSYDKSYKVQSRATDWLCQNITSSEKTLTLVPIFDWSETDFNFNVPITVQGKSLDFIVEEGTSNGWTYRKWNSGLAECWKILTHTTTMDSAWGALYCGKTLMSRQSYPFTFAEKPVEIVNLLASGNAGWLTPESGGNGMNGQYATAIYNVVRPNSVSTAQTFNFDFYVRGRWK